MGSQPSVKELIEIGTQIIASKEITESEILLASQFSEGVAIILAKLASGKASHDEIEELTKIHQKVLSRLKSQRDVVGKSLKNIRQKGKGIRAYLDQKRGRAPTPKKGKNS